MAEPARRRKPREFEVGLEDGTRSRRSAVDRSTTRARRSRVKLICVAMAVGLALLALLAVFGGHESGGPIQRNVARFLSSVTSRDSVDDHHGTRPLYAVMMDAGSTGSRILVFTFNQSPTDGSLKLEKEFYKEVKPGISSYHENPQQAADSIRGLFDDAKTLIPEDQWSSTPASLKATAGLRLLPGHHAENLLEAIREVFATSGFKTRPESVEIIDGTSEGLYSWTTINFLLDTLNNDLNETVAVFDMGGGSMQLSLVPVEASTAQAAAPGDIINIQLIGQPVQFYIRSYLGLGLMAVRLAVLQRSNLTLDADSLHFISPHFEYGQSVDWEFQGKKFNIWGSRQSLTSSEEHNQPVSTYRHCRQIIAQIVAESGVRNIQELNKRHLFAVSYFFDRAVEASLIRQDTGGFVRVQDFCRSARTVCEVPDPSQPFACIDLTYVCTLMEDGFGLNYDQVLNIKKKIDGHETSWALGAALSDLDREAANNNNNNH